jgi:hypothetical protein
MVGSVLPIGAIHVPIMLTIAALAVPAALLAVLGSGLARGRIAPVAVVTGVLALYCVLQALPLPFGWVLKLSPVAADVWSRALRPFGEGPPPFASLSLDPGASWVEAVRWWTYSSVIIAGATFGARHGERWSAVLILGSTVSAVPTLAHGMPTPVEYSESTRLWCREMIRARPALNSNTLAI